jgi:hypothetical protein
MDILPRLKYLPKLQGSPSLRISPPLKTGKVCSNILNSCHSLDRSVSLPTVINIFLLGIQKLVLAGRIGEAIETTQKLYPGLLERNQNLLFLLKCRQFVEMVSGHDSEVRGPGAYSPSRSNKSSPCSSPTHPHGSSSSGNSVNSSPHSSNGCVSNGIQNGVGRDVETLMEIEEEDEAGVSRNGVHNGTASQEKISCSPRRGNG